MDLDQTLSPLLQPIVLSAQLVTHHKVDQDAFHALLDIPHSLGLLHVKFALLDKRLHTPVPLVAAHVLLEPSEHLKEEYAIFALLELPNLTLVHYLAYHVLLDNPLHTLAHYLAYHALQGLTHQS